MAAERFVVQFALLHDVQVLGADSLEAMKIAVEGLTEDQLTHVLLYRVVDPHGREPLRWHHFRANNRLGLIDQHDARST